MLETYKPVIDGTLGHVLPRARAVYWRRHAHIVGARANIGACRVR